MISEKFSFKIFTKYIKIFNSIDELPLLLLEIYLALKISVIQQHLSEEKYQTTFFYANFFYETLEKVNLI